jgi:PHS family inorganic phosphate transporter-like MFS transporter
MLSTVFFMQPIGALIANIVAVVTVSAFHDSLAAAGSPASCTGHCEQTVDKMWRWIVGFGAIPPAFAILIRWWIPESPRYTLEVEMNPEKAKEDVHAYYPSDPTDSARSTTQAGPSRSIGSPMSTNDSPTTTATLTFGEPMEMKDLDLAEPAISMPTVRMVQKETEKEFWLGFWKYMITDGNWTDLAGTSLSWMTLDFAFYFLGVNSPKILSRIWNSTDPKQHIYSLLLQNSYRAIIAVSTGAVIGGLLFIKMSRFRYQLQFYGFWILAALFVAVGVCFVVLLGTRYFAAVIVLYSICNLFFNFGPNTSTFVISAECFPTKYRCSCHGISAAAGKFGSIIAQIFLAYVKIGKPGVGVNDPHSTWLGWVLLV